jgi:hypothetical protein
MQEPAKNLPPVQGPKAPSSKDVGQYRLQNGYTEFRFGILAPNMPNPFTSAPAHCCACARTIRADEVGEKVLFRGKKELGLVFSSGTPQHLHCEYEAPGIICSRCSSQGYHVRDFMQVGALKGEWSYGGDLVLQVGNPEVAAIWHAHLDRFAAAISQAMKESPAIRGLAGIRFGATSEKRIDPGSDKWVPPLENNPSDSRCFVVTACCGDPNAAEVVALRHFRDRFLLKTQLGAVLVQTYYRISPPLAHWLRENPSLAQLVRRYFFQPIARAVDSQPAPSEQPGSNRCGGSTKQTKGQYDGHS